jgi:hypothetical protein
MPELLHPRMSDVYREKVGSLCLGLDNEERRAAAREAIGPLIEAMLLEPDGKQLKITLKGDLAGLLSAARDSNRSPDVGNLLVQVSWLRGRPTSGTCSCVVRKYEWAAPFAGSAHWPKRPRVLVHLGVEAVE